MIRTAQEYTEQLKALLPRGRLWEGLRGQGKYFGEMLSSVAEEFSRIDTRSGQILEEIDPRTTYELIDEWEFFAGLPDPCIGVTDRSLQDRRGELHARLAGVGGQSIPYFIGRAAELGHNITITETGLSIAGPLQAGDELSASHANRYLWVVNVPIQNTYAFTSGVSIASDELGYWLPIRLECLFNRLKPAHTLITWNYQA